MDLNAIYKSLHAKGPKKTINGSCQCKAIEYTVDLPIGDDGVLQATRCNCTFCQKFGTTSLTPESADDFKLLKPSSREEISGDYTRDSTKQHRYFCNKCGVHVFLQAAFELEGKQIDVLLINLATFDQPQDNVDLGKVKINYWDGLHYNWASGMKDVRWPNGLP